MFRVTLILYILNPVRAFCENFPWLGAVVLLGLAIAFIGIIADRLFNALSNRSKVRG